MPFRVAWSISTRWTIRGKLSRTSNHHLSVGSTSRYLCSAGAYGGVVLRQNGQHTPIQLYSCSCLPRLARSEQNAHTNQRIHARIRSLGPAARTARRSKTMNSSRRPNTRPLAWAQNTRIMHGAQRRLLRVILVTSINVLPLRGPTRAPRTPRSAVGVVGCGMVQRRRF